jgi:hypothetical protein
VKGFARFCNGLGKNSPAILLIQLVLCLPNDLPHCNPKSLSRKWTGRALARLKLYFMYDTFFVPPLSAGSYRLEKTYQLKKCRPDPLPAL